MLEKLKNRKAAGFTLLELIVVLLILGVLAAVAVPTFATVRENSADRSAVTTAEAIARNANSIAASDADAGGVVDATIMTAAAGEADDSNANLTITDDAAGSVTVQVDSGSYSTCSIVSITSGVAGAGSAAPGNC